MSLKTIIDFVKSREKTQIQFKKHAIERLIQRNLNEDIIIDFITNKEIVGIHEQKRQVYKSKISQYFWSFLGIFKGINCGLNKLKILKIVFPP
jgi:uncharacterized protein YuzE